MLPSLPGLSSLPPPLSVYPSRYINSATMSSLLPSIVTSRAMPGSVMKNFFLPGYPISHSRSPHFRSHLHLFLRFTTLHCIIDSISYGDSFCILPVKQIKIANKNGLSADPWYRPTVISKSSEVPAAHRTLVLLFRYLSCMRRIYFSFTSFLSKQLQTSTRGTLPHAFSEHTIQPFLAFLYFGISCRKARMVRLVLLGE